MPNSARLISGVWAHDIANIILDSTRVAAMATSWVLLSGDAPQFQAVEAGSPFEKFQRAVIWLTPRRVV